MKDMQEKNTETRSAGGHQAVRRTIELLECISQTDEPVTASKIIQRTGLNKKTLYAMLETLSSMGIIQKNVQGVITFTDKLYRMTSGYPFTTPLVQASRLHIQPILNKYKLTITLCSTSENQPLTALYSTNIYVLPPDLPWYTASRGKLHAAHLPEDKFLELCSQTTFKAYTTNTICSSEQMQEERKQILSQGYAVDNGEFLEIVSCQSFPIYDGSYRLVGVLSCTADKDYMSSIWDDLIMDGLSCCRLISREMGWK